MRTLRVKSWPELILSSLWLTLDWRDNLTLPEHPGVYVFIRAGVVFYIGSSINVRNRVMCHTKEPTYGQSLIAPRLRAFRACDVVKVKLSQKFGDWLMWEARLIRRLCPEANKRING